MSIAVVCGAFSSQLDAFAFASPVLFVANALILGLTIFGVLTWKSVLFAVAVVAQIGLSVMLAPDLAAAMIRPGPHAYPASLKIMSANIWHENPDLTRFMSLIKEEQPDIIAVSEAGEQAIVTLNDALTDYPTRITCQTVAYCGVAIYARLPGQPIAGGAWISSGLQKPVFDPAELRIAAAELNLPEPDGRRILFYAVHLKRNGAGGPAPGELSRLLDTVGKSARPADTIIAGDFNATNWSWALRRFDDAVVPNRITLAIPTWPAPSSRWGALGAQVGLDHFFVGDGWRSEIVRRGPDIGSDHYPVLATLTPGK